jgi:hypothetical protein
MRTRENFVEDIAEDAHEIVLVIVEKLRLKNCEKN